MWQYARYMPLCALLTLMTAACATSHSQNNVTSEEMYLRTLAAQGMAENYSLENRVKECSMKERIDRQALYTYQADDTRKWSVDSDLSDSVMVRLDIKSNPFKGQSKCTTYAHGGLALSLKREAEAGTLTAYSGELISALRQGDFRELAQNIDREFGSSK